VADPKLVDVEVLGVVYEAARVRLGLVRQQEQASDGAARTTMADVGRSTLKKWKPPANGAVPKRPNRGGMKARPFRFYMPPDTYQDIKDRIRGAGFSVAGVIQDGLAHFARTGEY
jgi:hypothetical protein